MTSREIKIRIDGDTVITKRYHIDDGIWKLEHEKQVRKTIAEVQKSLTIMADDLVKTMVVNRG